MITEHGIAAQTRNGNLHVNLQGIFTMATAQELTALLRCRYDGAGNIFIHTDQLAEIEPQSPVHLSLLLGTADLPQEKIYLMGEKGMALCHEVGKVIRPPRRDGQGCCGRCRSCKCGGEGEQ